MAPSPRPTPLQLTAAYGKTVPDIIHPNLRVLFCGINPSLYSAAVRHHFARPGNRFWPALHQASFTPRQLHPSDELELLELDYGITNIVSRATASADELSPHELNAGATQLQKKILRYQPQYLAVLGISAYRQAFDQRHATIGLQQQRIGPTRIWVLPNPSGLNAHYTLTNLARMFRALRLAVESGR